MVNFEKKYMQHLKELAVNIWLRYVYDIFATIYNKQRAIQILSFLNKQHPNIRFTIEFEKNNELPFLDTFVKRSIVKYYTAMSHKKTFTVVYLNWTSLTSRKYKISLIGSLLNRFWKICSEQKDRDLESRKLKSILAKNEYPEDIVNKEFEKFIKSKNRVNINEKIQVKAVS